MKVKAVTQCSTNPQEKRKNPLHSINFAIVVATNAIVQRRAMLNFSTELSALASFADQREYFRDYQLSRTDCDFAIFGLYKPLINTDHEEKLISALIDYI